MVRGKSSRACKAHALGIKLRTAPIRVQILTGVSEPVSLSTHGAHTVHTTPFESRPRPPRPTSRILRTRVSKPPPRDTDNANFVPQSTSSFSPTASSNLSPSVIIEEDLKQDPAHNVHASDNDDDDEDDKQSSVASVLEDSDESDFEWTPNTRVEAPQRRYAKRTPTDYDDLSDSDPDDEFDLEEPCPPELDPWVTETLNTGSTAPASTQPTKPAKKYQVR